MFLKDNFFFREAKFSPKVTLFCDDTLDPGGEIAQDRSILAFWFLVMHVDKLNSEGRTLSQCVSVLVTLCPLSPDLYLSVPLQPSVVSASPLTPPPFCCLWATLSFRRCHVSSPFSTELFSRPEGETSDKLTDGCPRNSGIDAAGQRCHHQVAPD